MRFFNKYLNTDYPIKGGTLNCYLLDNPWSSESSGLGKNWKRPAVIIVPGGGYFYTSDREGEVVASNFSAKGFQCFVLKYLCRPQGAFYPEQLFELSCAIDFIRKNAEDFNINKDEIFTLGFSAGGHIVADQSCEYDSISNQLGSLIDCKPTAVALSYPVINKHDDSFENLLFCYEDAEKSRLKKYLNVDKLVSANTPPTFIWTTAEDSYVPPANSIDYARMLSVNKVPFELHIYPRGAHGKSIGTVEVNGESDVFATFKEWECLCNWVNDCARFFKSFCIE